MKRKLRKKIFLWVCGLALGFALVSCKSAPPKPAEPLSQRQAPDSSQEVSPPLPPLPVPEEVPAATPKPAPPPAAPAAASLPETAPRPKATFHTHIVKWNGETLSIIAAWYTGDPEKWKDISKANHLNPNFIYEGEKILIPEILLKTREPMPKNFVDHFLAKSKKEAARPKSPITSRREEEPKLFGPKNFQQR